MTEIAKPRVSIRRVVVGDADAVAALSGQLGYKSSVGAMARRIAKLEEAGETQAVFVACLADGLGEPEELVGWIDVAVTSHLQTEPFVLIGGLVVKDGVRGAGIGRMLCEKAEAWGLSQGITTMRVTSRSTRADAHRFYLRDGYAEIKTSKVFEKLLG